MVGVKRFVTELGHKNSNLEKLEKSKIKIMIKIEKLKKNKIKIMIKIEIKIYQSPLKPPVRVPFAILVNVKPFGALGR